MVRQTKVNTGSIFARPIEAETAPIYSHKSGVGGQGRAGGWTLAALMTGSCFLFLLTTRRDGAQSLPPSRDTHRGAVARKPVRIALAEGASAEARSDSSSRPSVDYYTRTVRDSMFSAPQPPKPKEAPAPKPPKIVPVVVPPVVVNPFQNWKYSGTVSAGDQKLALLENTNSKEGQYIREGQMFLGATVTSITDQMVTLSSAGKPYMVAKSDTINVTPLDKSAAYLTAPATPAPTGAPNAPAATGAAPAGVGSFTLPNGRVLTADQAARFQNRMNRRFNGGGGGRGGFGGFGGRGGGQPNGG